MIIDTSAVIAILRNEPDAVTFLRLIAEASVRRISAATFVETALVVDGSRDAILSRRLDQFVREWQLRIEPLTESHARIAREAYRDFGKGSGHPAQLNFGDCFSYALAKAMSEPLLFKGYDFVHTDVASALPISR